MGTPDRWNTLLAIRIDAVGPARLARLLHHAGGRVTLFSPPHLAAVRSRFVAHHVSAPADPGAFTEQLRGHLTKFGSFYQWVQIGDETVLRAVAERYCEDWTAQCLPVPRTPLHITLITNKLAFLALAARAGLPVPALEICTGTEEFRAAVRQIGFPLMLKRSEGMAGSGVRHVASAQELKEVDWTAAPEHPLMIQAYINGPVGSTEALFARGRPVAWLSSYHREFWPTQCAASCVRELTDAPEIEDMLTRIGAMTAYRGLAGVDWLREGDDGKIHLIELNPRPTPCYHLGPRVGVDFSTGLRGLLDGRSALQRPRAPDPAQSLVYQFPQYCYRAIDDRAFHRLARTVPDIPRDDPLLLAALLRRLLTHYLPSNVRGKLRNLRRTWGGISSRAAKR